MSADTWLSTQAMQALKLHWVFFHHNNKVTIHNNTTFLTTGLSNPKFIIKQKIIKNTKQHPDFFTFPKGVKQKRLETYLFISEFQCVYY